MSSVVYEEKRELGTQFCLETIEQSIENVIDFVAIYKAKNL